MNRRTAFTLVELLATIAIIGLPPGFAVMTSTLIDPAWGWAVYILPHIEQQNLFSQLNPTGRSLAALYRSGAVPAAQPRGHVGRGRLGHTFANAGTARTLARPSFGFNLDYTDIAPGNQGKGFSAPHPQGGLFVYLDGSVRFCTENTPPPS